MKKDKKERRAFSKTLLIQESVLIWIITIVFLFLAFLCIVKGFTGELPWLTVIVGFPWSAYGISQVYYYKKSMKENSSGGIVYDSAFKNTPTEDEAIIIEEDPEPEN